MKIRGSQAKQMTPHSCLANGDCFKLEGSQRTTSEWLNNPLKCHHLQFLNIYGLSGICDGFP